MRKTAKKFISLVAVATLFGSTLAMTACGGDYYKEKALSGYTPSATKTEAGLSNGGFAVEKGDYIYYINGKEDYAEKNAYGEVTKGALMRIKKSDLTAGNYDKADVVVPMMFSAQNYNSGIYIYGDYVYYATPTSDKNMKGEVTNSWIDFKRAKLDGSETMKDYYFRLSDNAAKYRFVAEGDTVYCLYEEDGMLKSYNTSSKKSTVLVKGATYVYDNKDLTNPNVYYTMGVTTNADSDTPTTETYNQVYCVNAAATASVDAKKASYTVNGKTYDFDEKWMEAQNDKAKATAKKNGTDYVATYDFDDYSTYPYVNLGTLVLDGVGQNQKGNTVFNNEHDANARAELKGYTYTLSRYENGGIYYTKAGDQTDAQLYYLAEDNGAANAVLANNEKEKIAWNTTNASTSALFELSEDGTHTYLYIADSKIYKVTAKADVVSEPVAICDAPSGATLWKTAKEGNDGVLYYYASGTHPVTSAATSGYNLSKIVYTGDETLGDKVYENLPSLNADAKFKPTTINYVDFSSGWYMPEMFDGVLMYANAEAIGSNSYNYIYATSLDAAKVKANNEAYETAYELMDDLTEKDTIKKAMTYYYRTGDTKLVKELLDKKLYTEEEYEVFTEYTEKQTVQTLVGLVGKDVIKSADKTAMAEDWKSTLPTEVKVTVEEEGLETWAICLIIAGSVLVVAAAVIIPVVILSKKKAAREQAEAIKNAYKRPKIDTTDDKSIDVYADDTAEEAPAEEAPVEATEETPNEEVVEAPVEE
jgi:hypothetical protein